MSGIAVGYGKPATEDIQRMLETIAHRGPDYSGVWPQKRVTMGQNYLEADLEAQGATVEVPICSSDDGAARVCFDGELGVNMELAQEHGVDEGPARAERLVLELYERFGKAMLQRLDDGVFALVVSDGEHLLAARDVLGIKTLFYGKKGDTVYFCSELKGLLTITEDVHEFPPGCYMDASGQITPFARLPEPTSKSRTADKPTDETVSDIRDIIRRSFQYRVRLGENTGALLSGGLDSSVVACVASEKLKNERGNGAKLRTFAIGVGESNDIMNARLVAEHLDTDHHELIVSRDDLLDALPEVIYYLESFDPSLVRSSVVNYLVSKFAADAGIKVLLSGEGGDEVFCGYIYLKQFPPEELEARQLECLAFLHSNAALRLDRMNQCHSVKVIAPLISGELLRYALRLPPEMKQRTEGDGKTEKWIFRRAFDPLLPKAITERVKQEFSQGSGSADNLLGYFDDTVSDDALREAQANYPLVRNKEELYYFNIFTQHFGTGPAVDTVGQWVTP